MFGPFWEKEPVSYHPDEIIGLAAEQADGATFLANFARLNGDMPAIPSEGKYGLSKREVMAALVLTSIAPRQLHTSPGMEEGCRAAVRWADMLLLELAR